MSPKRNRSLSDSRLERNINSLSANFIHKPFIAHRCQAHRRTRPIVEASPVFCCLSQTNVCERRAGHAPRPSESRAFVSRNSLLQSVSHFG